MAYIGNPPAEAYTNTVKDSFNGDGSTVAFTMSQPSVTNDVRVVVENVIQDPTVAYSCSGTTLTFTSAPPSGTNNIYVVHLGPAVMTTVPPSDIASATTFASAVTVQGAFTSQGIDDNATSTAMTLDGSGNLLVGKASNSFGTTGVALNPDGSNNMTRSGDPALALNRLTSDGAILGLYKDGTNVGSIGNSNGSAPGDLFICSTTSGHAGLGFGGGPSINPTNNAGALSDNTVSLGLSSHRFKDLYLSGGVYLGGTGSANKLDDYEAGTFTVGFTGATVSAGNYTGYYTKIGQVVHWNYYSQASNISGASGNAGLTGLPFTVLNNLNAYQPIVTSHNTFFGGSATAGVSGYQNINTTTVQFLPTGGVSPSTFVNGGSQYIMVSGTYITAS